MMFCFVGCVQGRSIWSVAVNQDETLIVSLLYRFGIITGILRVCVNSYIYVHLSVANFMSAHSRQLDILSVKFFLLSTVFTDADW